MNYLKYALSVILISSFLGCGNHREPKNQERLAHVFWNDSLNDIEAYDLSIVKEGSTIKYSYRNRVDESKHIFVSLDTNTQVLRFATYDFVMTSHDKLVVPDLKHYVFSFYSNNSAADDVTQPIYFNKDYGILGISNSDSGGPNIIFLTDENTETSRLLNDKL